MQQLQLAVAGLEQALACPPRKQRTWRSLVRQRMASVGDALTAERLDAEECELVARAGRLERERTYLLDRLGVLGNRLTEPPGDREEAERLRQRLQRLSTDIAHHQQRVNELAYDAAGRDVGGSE